MSEASPIAARSDAGVAVVWHASATLDASKLLAALAKGGLRVVNVRSAFAALAELRMAARVPGRPTPALVMVDPPGAAEALELHEAIERHVPRVKAWLFGPGANPRLRPIVESDVAEWNARVAPPVPVVRVIAHEPERRPEPERRTEAKPDRRAEVDPPLRLAGTLESDIGRTDGKKGTGEGDEGGAGGGKPLLTPEELELLLGDGRS
ncbi:MAG: hypothetical protein JNM80_06515 [Phycisphaerae bacterium]|nr:hypothetical protein [Phycisphaerae bacterium]